MEQCRRTSLAWNSAAGLSDMVVQHWTYSKARLMQPAITWSQFLKLCTWKLAIGLVPVVLEVLGFAHGVSSWPVDIAKQGREQRHRHIEGGGGGGGVWSCVIL